MYSHQVGIAVKLIINSKWFDIIFGFDYQNSLFTFRTPNSSLSDLLGSQNLLVPSVWASAAMIALTRVTRLNAAISFNIC